MGVLLIILQLILTWVVTDYLKTLLKRSKLNPKRQPPSPFPLPIIGNMLSLGNKPHRSFAKLAKAHGPAMLLKLGQGHALVISSPTMAREVLKTHDVAFSGRNVLDNGTAIDHHLSSIVLLPPDSRWRMYRKICTTLVFTNSRMEATEGLRRKTLQRLVTHVQDCSKTGEVVNIGEAAFVTIMNTLTNTFFSSDLVDHGVDYATKLRDLVWSTLEESSGMNLADLFPMLKKLDPQGTRRRVKGYMESMIEIFDRVIKQRLEHRKSHLVVDTQSIDVLDALLDLSDDSDNEFKHSDIHHLLIDLFIAGTETVSSTTEWAMTELLRHPEKMQKAERELQEIIGTNNLEETDICRLPYLRAIVKETFRVHPPTPFLVPRKVFTDTKLGEYTVPKNTKVLVNVWAIGQDPDVWEHADAFEPERFLDSSIDFKGRDFELIPFGSGRRMCAGVNLANRVLHLMLGSLIHSVSWKLEDGVKPEDIDLDEKFGFGLQKSKAMLAFPVPKVTF